ncbi:MAG: nucleoside transporter C-terminal domain-containing protein [Erythrobacter sp.]
MDWFDQFRGLAGIAAILLFAWALSEDRKARPGWKWIAGASALQLALALVIVRIPLVWKVFAWATEGVAAIERAARVGSGFIFGYLGGAELPFALKDGAQAPVVIAFQILPLVIVFSALSALLWHWRILDLAVRGLSALLRRTLGVSGAVGLAGGASVFLGPVESPLIVRAWLPGMSRSDLFAVMTLAMSTISGVILVLYAQTLSRSVPDAVGHMIAASLISLPAALLVARIMVPPSRVPDAAADGGTMMEGRRLQYDSSIDAVLRGTMDGLQIFLAVIAVIIVIFALVALVDEGLGLLPLVDGGPISVKRLFGWAFAPVLWLVGVPWAEAQHAGALMGTKTILNEYVAYLELAALPPGSLGARSQLIVVYALCGVANLASIGLLVSSIGTLCPERRAEAAKLGIRSWIAGNCATLTTGAWIGLVTLA